VDFKAACHCHQKPVEFAFMCSVCLTLTCQAADRCEVCATEARK
jgi:transcription initiation factor TFIIH subunit 3